MSNKYVFMGVIKFNFVFKRAFTRTKNFVLHFLYFKHKIIQFTGVKKSLIYF